MINDCSLFYYCICSFEGGAPNYYPNSFSGPLDNAANLECPNHCVGDVQRYNSGDDDNFTQAGIFWKKVISLFDLEFYLLTFNIIFTYIHYDDNFTQV